MSSRHSLALRRHGSARAGAALGARTSAAKATASAANGRQGGRPPSYRLTPDGALERRQGARWLVLDPPYDPPALAYLRRWKHKGT